ncbi:MAG: hypothetical protein ACR2N4_14655 [Jatrophihabitans sp.]
MKLDRRRILAQMAVSASAITLAIVHIVEPRWHVDSIVLALLAVAVVPWLGDIFESIDTPFGGLKFQDLARRLDELSGATQSLERRADTSESAGLAEMDDQARPARLEDLAAEYNRIRTDRNLTSGPLRTRMMTTLVGQMIAAVTRGSTIDQVDALAGADLGRRLAAYVSLYVHPESSLVIPVVDSVVDREPKPFGQYWGLRCLRRLIDVGGAAIVDDHTRRRLERYAGELPNGSDRCRELDRILESLAAA